MFDITNTITLFIMGGGMAECKGKPPQRVSRRMWTEPQQRQL